MKLLDIKAITELTTLSKSTIYRLIDQDAFPVPTKVKGRNVWSSEQVDEWMKKLTKESKHDTI